jgi:hypothetical protein
MIDAMIAETVPLVEQNPELTTERALARGKPQEGVPPPLPCPKPMCTPTILVCHLAFASLALGLAISPLLPRGRKSGTPFV